MINFCFTHFLQQRELESTAKRRCLSPGVLPSLSSLAHLSATVFAGKRLRKELMALGNSSEKVPCLLDRKTIELSDIHDRCIQPPALRVEFKLKSSLS